MTTPNATSPSPVNVTPASRLAAGLARQLEQLAAAPSLRFEDLEVLVVSSRALTRQLNAVRYRLEGAPQRFDAVDATPGAVRGRKARAASTRA